MNNNKNTPPTPVLQSQGAPPVAVVATVTEPEKELFKCDWKLCDGKHPEKVEYSNKGKGDVSRGKASSGSEYADEWVDQGLQPWVLYGSGKNLQTIESDFTEDIDPNKPNNRHKINKAMNLPPHEYITEKHHLISVHLFSDFPDLAHNAKLAGYNVNDKENGACFPYFRIDIIRHGLQCHRGKHPEPMYNDLVKLKLEAIDEQCKSYCESGQQEKIITKLNKISASTLKRLKDWEISAWYLRSAPETDQKWAEERIKNRK